MAWAIITIHVFAGPIDAIAMGIFWMAIFSMMAIGIPGIDFVIITFIDEATIDENTTVIIIVIHTPTIEPGIGESASTGRAVIFA